MKWNLVFKIVFLLVSITANNVTAFECKSIEACIALIPEIHDKELRYWDQIDDSVKIKLQSFGRKALIPLSKLTSESNHNRRSVADDLISDMKDLKDEDFKVIRKVIENNIKFDGNGGNAYEALGYIGSDTAVMYLISELKRVKSADNQIGTAFRNLGVKGLPFIIRGLRCFEFCREDEFRGFSEIFRPLYGIIILDDKSAIQLFNIAKNEKINIHARKTAMSIIGHITKNFELAHKINNYAVNYPDFSDSVLTSLENMKSPLAANFLVAKLKMNKDSFSNGLDFRDLSKLGINANSAGSEVITYLNSKSWQDRIHSAITLGYIGYSQAIPELRRLLSNKVDWQQSYAAIKALHLIGDKTTLSDIEVVANTHWYTPLKEYAKKVAVSIKSNESTESNYRTAHFPSDFFDYQYLRQENHVCDKADYRQIKEPIAFKKYKKEDLKSFLYKDKQCLSDEYKNDYKDYCASPQSFISPQLAVKYNDKWITGYNGGEWGGELMLFEKKKAPKSLLNANIKDVYVIGKYAYVISGLAHMSSNNGLIYRIEKVDSEYLIEPFYRLPGAPRTSWKTNDDSLLINTISGAVIFNPENGLKMAECTNK